jgi:hypothetical protein
MSKYRFGESVVWTVTGSVVTVMGCSRDGRYSIKTADGLRIANEDELIDLFHTYNHERNDATKREVDFSISNKEYLQLRDSIASELYLKRNKALFDGAIDKDKAAEECCELADTLIRHLYKRKIVIPIHHV